MDIYCNKSTNEIESWHLSSGKTRIFENCKTHRKLHNLFHMLWVLKMSRNCSYDAIIGIDAEGLIISFIMSKILRRSSKLGYFHLEFLTVDRKIKYILFSFLEKIAHKYCHFTIGLDKYRTKMLLKKNGIIRYNVLNIANLNSWEEETHIPLKKDISNKFIVFNMGSFTRNTLIEEILENLNYQNNIAKYIFRGWAGSTEIETKILEKAKVYPHSFIYIRDYLTENEYIDLLKNAHIGLAFYNPGNLNTRLTGMASGKLFEYWRFGIPVICHKNTGMEYLIDGTRAGICIDIHNLTSAINELIANYEEYSNNAYMAYKKYHALYNSKAIYNRLDSYIAAGKGK